ncbi:MAG: prephenate dehydrogenase/arogenate dehydrogenase family protein [Chloroflexi bacterium]|nr:prephenate dehydrogenase/arogenate dehydrogenase family protein [Chloroflexota bacterium]
MELPFNIAIVGLGLMGGSLALALRGRCAWLAGVDPDPQALAAARQFQAVDLATHDAAEALPRAEVVILAAPARAIIRLLSALPGLHPGAPIVLDVGSTKAHILRAMEALPERFDPIGGHPMCGKEQAGIAYAEAALFEGAPFAFTPLARTSPAARDFCQRLAALLGARPLWLDGETHDRWTAATSHLPYLLANALAGSVPLEAAPLVGPGYRSASRLAASSTRMMADILATNRANVLVALHTFQERLALLEASLAGGDEAGLGSLLADGAERQRAMTAGAAG